MNILEKDRKHVWHPFTQVGLESAPIIIDRAEGAVLYGKDGKQYIDAISSWWVNLHGHNHPVVTNAIKNQLDKLHQVIFAGCTHELAVRLAEELVKVLPENLTYIFYSDVGSTAVEASIKIAIQFWQNSGKPAKKRLISLEGGYHGDTLGAMSVGSRGVFNEPFNELMFNSTQVPIPKQLEDPAFEVLKKELAVGDVAAFIYEPLLQGAGGMNMYAPEVLNSLLTICKNFGILCIADEVFTGFGRTGRLFASDYCAEKPDIMCLSKALTAGSLPMGVSAVSQYIHEAFVSDSREKMLLHGHSFTANPLACAAALANLELIRQGSFIDNIKRIESIYEKWKIIIASHSKVTSVRNQGLVFAFEINVGLNQGYTSSIRDLLYPFFLEHGVLLRPLGNTVYIVPPVCISDQQLEQIFGVICEGLDWLQRMSDQ